MPFLDNSWYLLRVWWARAKVTVIREMEFRANFTLGLIRQLLWLLGFVFFIDITFRHTGNIAGWSKGEMLVILALSRLIEGTMSVLFSNNIMQLPELVSRGNLDLYLTKPLPVKFNIAFRSISVHNIGNVVMGICLLFYAFSLLPEYPSLLALLTFVLLATAGITIFYALLIITAALVFWMERLEALWGFLVLFSEPLTVPFDVFPRTSRVALTYLIPIAFVVFVPAQTLTGRLMWWQVPLALSLMSIFLLLAHLVWRAGLRRYSSASS